MEVEVQLHLSDTGELEFEVFPLDGAKPLGYFTSRESLYEFCYHKNDYDIVSWN